MSSPPLIVHLIYRLDFGGLETMLVERINRMPAERYRHAVVCLTHYTEFSKKITKPGVELYSLDKPPGMAMGTHLKLWKLLRKLKPAVVHTYNLSAVEYGVTTMLAGVPVRINGSHGRDASDPDGKNRKHNLLRRMMIPFYHCCYSNSGDLKAWNEAVVGVPTSKSRLLHNGIDTQVYRPGTGGKAGNELSNKSSNESSNEFGRFPVGSFVIGTVGRVQDIKDHLGLIDAFTRLQAMLPDQKAKLRLAIIGDGPLLPALKAKVAAAGIEDAVWLPGARTDVAAILRTFSLYVSSSIAEGTPGSVLEAMATALPVVGTRVGGVPEVVAENVTGLLVPARDPQALAVAIARYVVEPGLAAQHGKAGLERVSQKYSMVAMLSEYLEMYDALCNSKVKNSLQGVKQSCVE
ncbi:MAG: glycosyl transferase group 1 protein [Herminiimonas sp.]|nr:glycosyl transferase group 1 protein [Herminiimonas sp.]